MLALATGSCFVVRLEPDWIAYRCGSVTLGRRWSRVDLSGRIEKQLWVGLRTRSFAFPQRSAVTRRRRVRVSYRGLLRHVR